MRVAPPRYLYKYRAVDADALAMLASDKVYLSRLDAFNDPYEFLNLENDVSSSVVRRDRSTLEKVSGNSESTAASLRVCALSEECRDLLMWGHYADRHRGFCIRFEFGKDPELSKLLYPVDYEPTFPEIKERDESLEKALSSTLTKSEKWSYEREWRIVGRVPEGDSNAGELFATYRPAAITGIIFGVRTPDLHKSLIRKVL